MCVGDHDCCSARLMENEDCKAEAECGLGPYCHCLRVLYRTFGESRGGGNKKVGGEGTSSDLSCEDKSLFVSW